MSESAPRSNPRLENFEANKAAHEQKVLDKQRKKFEKELYGNAGRTDFSSEAKSRVEEADAYERHLEKLQGRQEAQDVQFADGRPFVEAEIDDSYSNPYMDNLHAEALEMNEVHDAGRADAEAVKEAYITSLMQSDPNVRQMQMIAQDIARIGGTAVTPENDATLSAALKDKEDRLQELLVKFSEESNYTQADIDEISNRLIDMTEAAPVADEVTTGKDKSSADSEPMTGEASEAESDEDDDVVAPLPIDVDDETKPDDVDKVEPLPIDAQPVDNEDDDKVEPLPIEASDDVEPLPIESRKWTFAEILNHPGDYSRSRKDALKRKLDKFRGQSTKEKAVIIGAGIAVTAISILAYQWAKNGMDTTPLHEAGNKLSKVGGGNGAGSPGDSLSAVKAATEHAFSAASDAVSAGAGELFSNKARTVVSGEGWGSTLSQMGMEPKQIPGVLNKLLTSTDPAVKEWVYTMKDGNPGISHTGQIPTSVLQSIMNMRG